MSREGRLQISKSPFLGDDGTDVDVLRHESSERPSRLGKRLCTHACKPLFGRCGFHLGGAMKAEAICVTQKFDYLVPDDLGLAKRPTNHHARSPARVNADSNRALHSHTVILELSSRNPRIAHACRLPRLSAVTTVGTDASMC